MCTPVTLSTSLSPWSNPVLEAVKASEPAVMRFRAVRTDGSEVFLM